MHAKGLFTQVIYTKELYFQIIQNPKRKRVLISSTITTFYRPQLAQLADRFATEESTFLFALCNNFLISGEVLAWSNGVLPSLQVAWGSAPYFNSSLTTSTEPKKIMALDIFTITEFFLTRSQVVASLVNECTQKRITLFQCWGFLGVQSKFTS